MIENKGVEDGNVINLGHNHSAQLVLLRRLEQAGLGVAKMGGATMGILQITLCGVPGVGTSWPVFAWFQVLVRPHDVGSLKSRRGSVRVHRIGTSTLAVPIISLAHVLMCGGVYFHAIFAPARPPRIGFTDRRWEFSGFNSELTRIARELRDPRPDRAGPGCSSGCLPRCSSRR